MDKWYYHQRAFIQDILNQEGLVMFWDLFRLLKINICIMMHNLEGMYSMSRCSDRVYIPTTGFLKLEEEEDISKLREL